MKQDFPLLNTSDVAYLDSAATTQKPQQVIDMLKTYYEKSNANIHRGIYELSVESTRLYDEARKTVATFLNAQFDEIVFTKGTTDGLNLLASSLPSLFNDRKRIVLTELEHHANMIPWQELAKKEGFEIKYIRVLDNGELDYAHAAELITEETAMVSFTHVSNALGTSIDAGRLIALAKKAGAYSIVDAAQSIAHQKIDVKTLDCDFLVFSGHKAYGPTGIGVLYAKREHLTHMKPYQFGGDMIRTVTYESATYADAPEKFEAGTPNIAGAIGLARALNYLTSLGWEHITQHEQKMTSYLRNALLGHPAITVHSPENTRGIVSFMVNDVHPHDVASILSEHNVCIRAGHHCAMPLMHKLGVPGLCRASIGIYTERADIDKLIKALEKTTQVFA